MRKSVRARLVTNATCATRVTTTPEVIVDRAPSDQIEIENLQFRKY